MDKLSVKDSVRIFIQKPTDDAPVEVRNVTEQSDDKNKAEGTKDGKQS